LLPDLAIEHLAELHVGLHAECIQHLGEEAPAGRRKDDVDDVGIVEALVAQRRRSMCSRILPLSAFQASATSGRVANAAA
jgi:hypothetical protein